MMTSLGMTKQEKRQYLKDLNHPSYMKYHCPECEQFAAVVTDVRMQEDYGEAKGKEYRMLVYKCLSCQEIFEDWDENE